MQYAQSCISCNILEGRNECGFLGHGDRYGCSRCGQFLERCVGQKEYRHDSWPTRRASQHKQVCQRLLNCNTK